MTFTTVVKAGTFLATSRALGYSQSTVTLHIQELEHELGVPLFQRAGKRVALTEAGRRLTTRATQILDALGELTRDMASLRGGGAGTVRIGVIEPTASVRLPPVLAALCAALEGLDVRLEIAGTGTVVRRVAAGELDFGIATPPDPDTSLRFEPLFEERLVLAVPRGAPLARRRSISVRDLEHARVLLTEQGCAYRRAVQAALSRDGRQIPVVHEIGSVAAILSSVRSRLGVGIVPLSAVPSGLPGVVSRAISDLDVRIPVGLVLRAAVGSPSPAAEAALSHIRSGLRRKSRSEATESGPRKR